MYVVLNQRSMRVATKKDHLPDASPTYRSEYIDHIRPDLIKTYKEKGPAQTLADAMNEKYFRGADEKYVGKYEALEIETDQGEKL